MVETVLRSLEAPFFNKRVTEPVAFDQVMSNAVPVLTLTNCEAVIVNCAAWATARAAPARRTLENCILNVVKVFEVERERTVVDIPNE